MTYLEPDPETHNTVHHLETPFWPMAEDVSTTVARIRVGVEYKEE